MAKAVATVEDFDKLKNKDTGLVPMTFLVPTITERVGDIRGAEPFTALRWYNDGLAEPAKGKVSAKPENPDAGRLAETDADKRKSGITIPDDWRSQHHLKNIALAKDIVSDKERSFTKEQAETEIQGELDRRAQVATGGPHAITSSSLRTSS